jgi:hypothetical protein
MACLQWQNLNGGFPPQLLDVTQQWQVLDAIKLPEVTQRIWTTPLQIFLITIVY